MALWTSIQRFFRDAKVTEFYVKISKEEFQGNLQRACDMCESARRFVESANLEEEERQRHLEKIGLWYQDLQRKLDKLTPEERARERRRFF